MYVNNQLWFWKYSFIFLFYSATFRAFLHFFGPFGAILFPFGAFFEVRVRFKNIFGTYACRQSTLVLEILPYLFIFNSAKFGVFCTFWVFRGYFLAHWSYFWGRCQVKKHFLEPTYVNNQLWFWKYSTIFLFRIQPNLGPFLHFFCLLGLFLGLGSGSNFFGTYLNIQTTFILKV